MNPDPTSLDRLHDIVAPPPVPWWPPAPGWYWVLGFLLVVVLVLVLRSFLHWQRNRYRREALAELKHQESALADPTRRAAAIPLLAELLKRTALSAWPRETVASLIGLPWLDFLDRSTSAKLFSENGVELLERVSYDPRAASSLDESQVQQLIRQTRAWIRHHRSENPPRRRARPRPRSGEKQTRTRTRTKDEEERSC